MYLPVISATADVIAAGLVAANIGGTIAQTSSTAVATAAIDAATEIAAAEQVAAAELALVQKEKNDELNFGQKILKFTKDTANRIKDNATKTIKFIKKYSQTAFMFVNAMKMAFQFFSIIVLVRMIIGFFTKPLEFIMLGMSCLILAVVYVIYFIFSIEPFIYIPFILWFFIADVMPFVIYSIVMGVIFIGISIFCLILAFLNVITGGSLKSLILCQNTVAAWFKTPNYHLTNKNERGLFCSRQCYTGYFPDTSGMYCMKVPKGNPSFCPQAEVMRMYTGNRNDMNYYYKDYQTNGNLKYLMKSPKNRELVLKNHYLKKRDFIEKCEKSMSKYNSMPLSLCSSLDIYEKNNINGIDKKTIEKMKKVCSQAFCNSKTNYPFCSSLGTSLLTDTDNIVSEFWKKVIKIFILIIVFMFIIMFTLSYMIGINQNK